MKGMLLALAVLMLSACATVSVPLAPALAVASPGTHVVTVQNDNSMMPVAQLGVCVFVDGQLAATLRDGRAVNLHLIDGRHLIGIGSGGYRLPTHPRPTQEIAVDVSATSQPVLRAHYVAAGWGGIKLEPVVADR